MINICNQINQGEEEVGENVKRGEQGDELVPVHIQEVDVEHGEGFVQLI